MGAKRVPGGRGGGLPVRTFEAVPGVPPVRVLRFPLRGLHRGESPGQAHIHDFLSLAYFEGGGGSLRLDDREWRVDEGDEYVIAPGEVIGGGEGVSGFWETRGWNVSFPPEVLGDQAPGAFLSWRAHGATPLAWRRASRPS